MGTVIAILLGATIGGTIGTYIAMKLPARCGPGKS